MSTLLNRTFQGVALCALLGAAAIATPATAAPRNGGHASHRSVGIEPNERAAPPPASHAPAQLHTSTPPSQPHSSAPAYHNRFSASSSSGGHSSSGSHSSSGGHWSGHSNSGSYQSRTRSSYHGSTSTTINTYHGKPSHSAARYRAWNGKPHRFEHHDYAHFSSHDRDVWRHGHWRHGHHNGRDGWWWFAGGAWYFYTVPVYPYPGYVSTYYYDDPYFDGYYTPYAGDVPPANAYPAPEDQAAPNPEDGGPYWYYCRDPEGYYPYVRQCRGPWEAVPPTPDSANGAYDNPGYRDRDNPGPQIQGPDDQGAYDDNGDDDQGYDDQGDPNAPEQDDGPPPQ